MENRIWFVVHRYELWDIDNRLIGFWKKTQWDNMRVGDYVIYYRAGEKRIKGLFRICDKGISLNPAFSSPAIKEKTIYQCRLRLLTDDVLGVRVTTDNRLSFHDELRKNRYGGLGKQIFSATSGDVKLLFDREIIPDADKMPSEPLSDESGPGVDAFAAGAHSGMTAKPIAGIISEREMVAGGSYENIKAKIGTLLASYMDLYRFDDQQKIIYFLSEGPLIPKDNGRIPVLILLSNPHPHSVRQGMILSPNSAGLENPFWGTLRASGGVLGPISANLEIMLENRYDSPFRFFMAVLLPFPTEDPKHLTELFGSAGYEDMLTKGVDETRALIVQHGIRSVICFGRLQYEAVTGSTSLGGYIAELLKGRLLRSPLPGLRNVNAYLTYPTGWRYRENARALKAESLRRILLDIKKSASPG